MKGVFESRRPKPKYTKIWDVGEVLKHLSTFYPYDKLALKDLTYKVLIPRNPNTRIEIARYEPDVSICPFTCLQAYINSTKGLREDETKLFVSYVRPHKPVSRGTISRWTKETLHLCGVDTKVFSAHSTRSASVSKASAKDVPFHEIMARAGWKSAETFHKYYNKPVIQEN
ncbi:unnamed protein product, partial [Porites evermanni]